MSTGQQAVQLPTDTPDDGGKYNSLLNDDALSVLKAIPQELISTMHSYGPKMAITGGFIRDIITCVQPNDIDIATDTLEVAEAVVEQLARPVGIRVKKAKAWTIIGYRYPIQVFKALDNTQAITSFAKHDFTVNGAALWYNGDDTKDAFQSDCWKSRHCGYYYYPDIAARRLRVLDVNQDYGKCIYRMMKFVRKGFRIEPRDHATLLLNMLQTIKFEEMSIAINGGNPFDELVRKLTSQISAGKYENIVGDVGSRMHASIDEEDIEATWLRNITQGIVSSVGKA